MTKSNSISGKEFNYTIYWIALILLQTFLQYEQYDESFLRLFLWEGVSLFAGLFEFLVYTINYEYSFGSSYATKAMIWISLVLIPIFVAGARNFSPPYSTFILFYFVGNITGYIFFTIWPWLFGYSLELVMLWAIAISLLILHLNIIFSKNPIVKGIDNLAITFKLPSSSGSSSLGDDLD